MGPTWVPAAPDGPHVGPMNLAIRVCLYLIWVVADPGGSHVGPMNLVIRVCLYLIWVLFQRKKHISWYRDSQYNDKMVMRPYCLVQPAMWDKHWVSGIHWFWIRCKTTFLWCHEWPVTSRSSLSFEWLFYPSDSTATEVNISDHIYKLKLGSTDLIKTHFVQH